MQLKFKQNTIPPYLWEELGFAKYLSIFELEIPLISEIELREMSSEQAGPHFSELINLQSEIHRNQIDIQRLISQSAKLPNLEVVILAYENQILSPTKYSAWVTL